MHYSYSQISCFAQCHRKYFWAYILYLESKVNPLYRVKGKTYHKGLATWYKTGDEDAALDVMAKTMLSIPTFSPTDINDKEKAILDTTIALNAYMAYYKNDTRLEPKQVEQLMEVDGVKFIVDMIGNYDGQPCVVEHKTTTKLDEHYLDRTALDLQLNLYIYLLRKHYNRPKMLPLKLYRITKYPSLRIKKNETPSQFQLRIINDYLERPDYYFINEVTQSQDWQIELAGSELEYIIRELNCTKNYCDTTCQYHGLINCMSCGAWYRDTSKCSMFGGCTYLPLCKDFQTNRMFFVKKGQKR